MSRIKTAEESGIDIKTYKGKLYDGSYDLHNQTNVTNSYLTWEDALEALETEIRDHSPSERSYICNAHVCEIVECIGTNSRIVDPATCEFVESEYDTVDWKNKQKQWDIEKDYERWDNTQESGVEVLLASTKKINDSYFGTESRDYSKISGFIEFLLDDLDLDKDKGCFDVCLLTLLEEIAHKLRNGSIRDDS